MYKLMLDLTTGNLANCVKNVINGYVIPTTDPANTDYQAYLKWLAEGNTPLPADEPTA
jgi:hypothetical protein